MMEKLDRKTAPQACRYPDKVIQFGEGNFLRAFVDWIIWNLDKKAGFNGGVVVVQPIEKGMVDMLNGQDGLYHLNLQGIGKGAAVDSIDLIDVINRGINPYHDFDGYLALAENPDIRFVVSNTTEAGIAFDPSCRLEDRPASSYPGKLTQLLYHRYEYFKGDMSRRRGLQGMVQEGLRGILYARRPHCARLPERYHRPNSCPYRI